MAFLLRTVVLSYFAAKRWLLRTSEKIYECFFSVRKSGLSGQRSDAYTAYTDTISTRIRHVFRLNTTRLRRILRIRTRFRHVYAHVFVLNTTRLRRIRQDLRSKHTCYVVRPLGPKLRPLGSKLRPLLFAVEWLTQSGCGGKYDF